MPITQTVQRQSDGRIRVGGRARTDGQRLHIGAEGYPVDLIAVDRVPLEVVEHVIEVGDGLQAHDFLPRALDGPRPAGHRVAILPPRFNYFEEATAGVQGPSAAASPPHRVVDPGE